MLRPRRQVSGDFWILNFSLFGFGFRPHVSVESCVWIGNFLNLFSREEILIRYESGIVWTFNPNILLSGDVTRSSPVLTADTAFKMATSFPRFSQGRARCKFRALYDACSVVKSWVLEWIPIRVRSSDTVDGQTRFEWGYVWTLEFLNPERKSCEFKNIQIRVWTGLKCLKNGSNRVRNGHLIRRRILGERPNSLGDETRMKSPWPWVAKYIVPFSYLKGVALK